ncbi:hypothetical protein FNH22_05110 [Fulvivirga sp. M361]|uniref:hypothetical protein n=1 Tax=Fulvivirga sp. M361 TaxID=2594266 RepID=UPI00117B4450|nr:hypothetical protein [Fulvivirga sp. M361]TRX61436.1 hypothetical protein FNH22_05110 [Fulvivirga sp. M361]
MKTLSLQSASRIEIMEKVIGKELISHLLLLENDQQEKVLTYIKDLLNKDEMNRRADVSERDIAEGKTITSSQFNKDFENWKKAKRNSVTR